VPAARHAGSACRVVNWPLTGQRSASRSLRIAERDEEVAGGGSSLEQAASAADATGTSRFRAPLLCPILLCTSQTLIVDLCGQTGQDTLVTL
jgi:hypothetical protein